MLLASRNKKLISMISSLFKVRGLQSWTLLVVGWTHKESHPVSKNCESMKTGDSSVIVGVELQKL